MIQNLVLLLRNFFNTEYITNNNTTLSVTTVNGEIKITTWDGDNVTLNATKQSRRGYEDLENVEIVVTENNDKIIIEIQQFESIYECAVDLDILVPHSVTVESATSTNGPIQISGTKGNIIILTTNGPITIENVDGYAKASSTNGGIDIQGKLQELMS